MAQKPRRTAQPLCRAIVSAFNNCSRRPAQASSLSAASERPPRLIAQLLTVTSLHDDCNDCSSSRPPASLTPGDL